MTKSLIPVCENTYASSSTDITRKTGSMSPSGVAIGVGTEELLLRYPEAKPSRRLLAGPSPAKLHMLHQLRTLLEAVRRNRVHASELCTVRWLSQTSLSLELCIAALDEKQVLRTFAVRGLE